MPSDPKKFIQILQTAFVPENSARQVLDKGLQGLRFYLRLEPVDQVPGIIGGRCKDRIGGFLVMSLRRTLDSQIPGRPNSYKVGIDVINRDEFGKVSYFDTNTFLFTEQPGGALQLAAARFTYRGHAYKTRAITPELTAGVMNMLGMASDCCNAVPTPNSFGEQGWFREEINKLPKSMTTVERLRPRDGRSPSIY